MLKYKHKIKVKELLHMLNYDALRIFNYEGWLPILKENETKEDCYKMLKAQLLSPDEPTFRGACNFLSVVTEDANCPLVTEGLLDMDMVKDLREIANNRVRGILGQPLNRFLNNIIAKYNMEKVKDQLYKLYAFEIYDSKSVYFSPDNKELVDCLFTVLRIHRVWINLVIFLEELKKADCSLYEKYNPTENSIYYTDAILAYNMVEVTHWIWEGSFSIASNVATSILDELYESSLNKN